MDHYALSYTGNKTIENKKSIIILKNNRKPRYIFIPKKDVIIYESHIGLFTKSPSSNTLKKAIYSALKEKISYLKDLGINVVKFLSILNGMIMLEI